MKIIDYNKFLNKKDITDKAYKICNNVSFPVEYLDVYDHLFGKENLILKLLVDEQDNLSDFGVFENYKSILEDEIVTMLYLSGMVTDKKFKEKTSHKRLWKVHLNK